MWLSDIYDFQGDARWRGRLWSLLDVLYLFVLTLAAVESTLEVRGAGASFPRNVYYAWNLAYQQNRSKHIDLEMRYESIGSGGGKARIKGEGEPMVHYAGSDSLLTEAENQQYPDLKMVPTMVGAVVMAFNLPGVDKLTLSLEALTGMYNGSIQQWNDPVVSSLNPQETLPDAPIIVISRSDKSGTTEAFTRGLSAYSPEWKATYGTFSDGLDDNGEPMKWKKNVVKYFGFTNRGMNGIILSLRYSVGYMSIADVKAFDMAYASMKNRDGYTVDVNVTTEQSAVINANKAFEFMNVPGPLSFPLVTATYFIVNMRSTFECEAMAELVRYMDWFYCTEKAKDDAIHFGFTPMDSATIDSIKNEILRNMTCNSRNLWDMMRAEMLQESLVSNNNTWELPIYLTVAALVLIIITLVAIFARQQIQIHQELLKNSWLISPESVGGDSVDAISSVRIHNFGQSSDNGSDTYVGSVFTPENHSKAFSFGMYDDQVVTMIQMNRYRLKFTIRQKKVLLAIRDSISHGNVMKFMGLTNHNSEFYICHAGKIRITLAGLLKNSKVTINDGGKLSMVKDIVSGMRYLHKKGIVHGNLRADNIMIDMAWNIRIAAWIETHVATQETGAHSNKIQPTECCLQLSENDNEKSLYWMAPEIIKYKRCPIYSSDMYSFGMVLQEIFSRREPFEEIGLPPSEVIGAVLTCCLRPTFYPNTPPVIKSVMESCWGIDPAQRPSFHAVDSLIKNEYPKHTHLLDTIIESLQQYAAKLSRDIADSNREAAISKTRLQAQMACFLPDALATTILTGQSVEAQTYDQATVMAFQITNLPQLICRVTSQGIVNTLNKFYDRIDHALASEEVFKINRFVCNDLYVSGIPTANPKHALTMSHCALRVLMCVEDFSNDHLAGLDLNLTVAIAIASGPLVAGILGKLVAQYVVIGQPLTEAIHLLEHTQPGSIQLSDQTYWLVKNERSLVTNIFETLKVWVDSTV